MATKRRGQAKKTNRKKGSGRKKWLLLLGFELAAYGIMIVSCAFLTLHSDADGSYDGFKIVGALALAAFCCAYYAGRLQKQNGLLTGFLSTLPIHLLLLLLSLAVGGFRADWTLLFSFVSLSLVSMLGGVLAVNRRETPRVPAAKR